MELMIKSIRPETPSVTSFVIEKPHNFRFTAGQFLQLELAVQNCDLRCNKRPFSIASSPTEDFLLITTRHGVSRFKETFEHLPPSATIKAVGPMGRFTIDEKDTRPIVFLSGGVGITPMRSMIKYLLDTHSPIPMTLIFSNKTPKEIVFGKEFENWSKQYRSFRYITTITSPDEDQETVWDGNVGRITGNSIREYVGEINSVRFYISGPIIMVKAMKDILMTISVQEEHIKTEQFSGY